MTPGVIGMLALVMLAGIAILLWHMQRPRPRRVAISFSRFVPPLTPAPGGWHRIALAWPRDTLALASLLGALALLAWALIDESRHLRASQSGHIGIRIVLDATHSMAAMDGDRSRFERALDQIETARRIVAEAGADSLCLEIASVGAGAGEALPLAVEGPLPAALPSAPLLQGGEPARLLEAALVPDGACPITRRLVVTDTPFPGMASAANGVVLLWDQVGVPVPNIGLHGLALDQASLSPEPARLRIEGVASGMDAPHVVHIEGPGGARDVDVTRSLDTDGRWSATASFDGPGRYRVKLAGVDGYGGDDVVEAEIAAPARMPVDWRLGELPRPVPLGSAPPGSESGLLVMPYDPATGTHAMPVLFTYPGFSATASPQRVGAFLDDPPLLDALNLDALEAAMPRPFPGSLPAGFVPVLTDEAGGVIVARRAETLDQARGLLVPTPRPDLPEPARSLSVTLFFSALAEMATPPAAAQSLIWLDRSGQAVSDARLESLTGRPLAPPAELQLLAAIDTAVVEAPLWPFLVMFALAALAAERGLRLGAMVRRGEAVP